MRRLFLILIALSLSSITMGHACDMSGAVPQLACCCDAEAPDSCPEPARNCTTGATADASGGGCCSIVITSGTSAQGEPETLPTPDLPLLDPSIAASAALRPARSLAMAPRLRANANGAPPIYLLTGRLRR